MKIEAILWCVVIVLLARVIPVLHVPGKLRYRTDITGYGVMGAFFYLAFRYLIGFAIQDIALSPYDLTPRGMVLNVLDILPMVAGREMLRAYLVGYAFHKTKRTRIWLVVIAFVFGLFALQYSRILALQNMQQWFIYIAEAILPTFALSGLLTTLAWHGGYKAGLFYSAITGLFPRIFPVLPNLPWLAESVAGIVFPAVLALYIRDRYQENRQRYSGKKAGSIVGFVISLAAIILFGWFMVGVFPIYPHVILTGSMQPGIDPGDIILIEKITKEEEVNQLKETEIISFRREDIMITHRIQKVISDEAGNISFETKGDNNNGVDSEVLLPSDVRGRLKGVIPKLGNLILWFRIHEPIPEGVIDEP